MEQKKHIALVDPNSSARAVAASEAVVPANSASAMAARDAIDI